MIVRVLVVTALILFTAALFRAVFAAFLTMLDGALFAVLTATVALVVLATLLVAFVAVAMFAAFLATFPAAAEAPGNHLNFDLWLRRVVAFNHQFAAMRLAFGCVVANHDIQARPGMQRIREWIMNEAPMTILMLKSTLGYVQIAITDVANGDRAEGFMATLHAAEVGAAGYHNLPRGSVAGNIYDVRTRRIVASYGNAR